MNAEKVVENIAPLRTIEPAGINAVAEDEWVEIEVAVDSGATEMVTPEETLNGIIGITESAACQTWSSLRSCRWHTDPEPGRAKFPRSNG